MIDATTLRQALGHFATGVTVVTTRDVAGEPIGVTASSFNTVSLDPPLVLWSIGRNALSYPAFSMAEHFAIHVLGDEQQAWSNRFGRASEASSVAWTSAKALAVCRCCMAVPRVSSAVSSTVMTAATTRSWSGGCCAWRWGRRTPARCCSIAGATPGWMRCPGDDGIQRVHGSQRWLPFLQEAALLG